MLIRLERPGSAPARLLVEQPENLTSLAVHVPPALDGELDDALRASSAGYAEPGSAHVYLSTTWLRGVVGERADKQFDAMLDFAAGRGWLDESRQHVRAHVGSAC